MKRNLDPRQCFSGIAYVHIYIYIYLIHRNVLLKNTCELL